MICIYLGYLLTEAPVEPRIGLILDGAFEDSNENSTTNFLYADVQISFYSADDDDNANATDDAIADGRNSTAKDIISTNSAIISELHAIPLIADLDSIDHVIERRRTHVFNISQSAFETIRDNKNATVRIRFHTNIDESLPVQIAYDPSPIDKVTGVIYASVVLLGLYIMIIWEVVHRTFAAMIASTLSIAILAYMNERPTMAELMSWIDVETLLLLFGMMILVAILSETGIFDYLAVYAYKVGNQMRDTKNLIITSSFQLSSIFSLSSNRLQMDEFGL